MRSRFFKESWRRSGRASRRAASHERKELAAGGYEYNLILATAALAIAFLGPGSLSVDSALGLPLGGTISGVGALVVGVLGAAVQLAFRRPRSLAAAATDTVSGQART